MRWQRPGQPHLRQIEALDDPRNAFPRQKVQLARAAQRTARRRIRLRDRYRDLLCSGSARRSSQAVAHRDGGRLNGQGLGAARRLGEAVRAGCGQEKGQSCGCDPHGVGKNYGTTSHYTRRRGHDAGSRCRLCCRSGVDRQLPESRLVAGRVRARRVESARAVVSSTTAHAASMRVARNGRLANDDEQLHEGDEIAVIASRWWGITASRASSAARWTCAS